MSKQREIRICIAVCVCVFTVALCVCFSSVINQQIGENANVAISRLKHWPFANEVGSDNLLDLSAPIAKHWQPHLSPSTHPLSAVNNSPKSWRSSTCSIFNSNAAETPICVPQSECSSYALISWCNLPRLRNCRGSGGEWSGWGRGDRRNWKEYLNVTVKAVAWMPG